MTNKNSCKNSKLLSIFVTILAIVILFGIWNFNGQTTYAKGPDKATREYKTALSAYNSAVSRLNAAERKNPSFNISGEITHRYSNELWIWGYATSSYASPSHPGWITQPGNIIIKNYNSNNISYNNYYGSNYYLKQTTGVGLFGQDVPVNVYGSTPSKIIQLKKAVERASATLYAKKLKLPAEFSIRYKGKPVTDNSKHPIKLDGVPFTISLSNKSKGAESSSWYLLTGKNKWKFLSNSTSPKVDIMSEKATLKLVINHNKKNYKIHKVYVSLPATGFNDIPRTSWAAPSIIKVTKSGLMKDYKDGKFHPNTAMTKGQFAKLIVQAYKMNTIKPANPTYSDVSKKNPYYPYIEATKYYFTGTFSTSKNARFNPNSKIRRDEAAAVITRLTLLDRQSINGEQYLKQNFTDYKKISSSLYKLVAIAVNKNLILGYNNGKFYGSSALDRATTAYLLNKTKENYYSKYNDNVKFSSTIPASSYKDEVPISMKLSGNAKVYLNNKLVSFDYYGKYENAYSLPSGEGNYNFTIKIVQPFKMKEMTKKLIYKIPAPSLKIGYLPTTTDSHSLTISGAVTDKNDENPKIYINNKQVYTSYYDGRWSEDFKLNEGNNTFVIKAVNSLGKMTTVTKVVKFTPAVPVLTVDPVITSTTLDSITISGTVADKNDDLPAIYINDQEVYVSSYGGNWSKDFVLEEGNNTFIIKAKNNLGKMTTVTKVVTFTPDLPVLSVNPVASSTDLDTITISGKVTDKNDDLPEIYINDQEVYVYSYSGTWSKDFVLEEGNNTFIIKAKNNLGKITTVTKVITFTPGEPVLTVNPVLSSTDLDTITISGKVTDKNDDLPVVMVNDQEVYVSSYGGTWSQEFVLDEGDNTYVIKAKNKNGKMTTVTKVVTFTPDSPVLTVNPVVTSTDLDSITISGKVTDKNDDLPIVYVNDEEVYVSSYGGTWSKEFALDEGDNTFVIKAQNKNGKMTTTTKIVTFTPSSPVLTVNPVVTSTDLDSITISGKVMDKNDDLPIVYVNDEEMYVSSYGGTWSQEFALDEGENTFVIKAQNKNGKITTVTKAVTFTPGSPVLTVNPIPTTTTLATLTISGRVTDKNDELPRVYVNDLEIYVNSYGGYWSNNFPLKIGENTFVIKAVNRLGKITTETHKISYSK